MLRHCVVFARMLQSCGRLDPKKHCYQAREDNNIVKKVEKDIRKKLILITLSSQIQKNNWLGRDGEKRVVSR